MPAVPPPPPRRSSNPDHYHETMSMTQMYKQAHMAATVAAPPPPQTPGPPMHPHQLRTSGPNNQYAPTPNHYSPATPSLQRHPSNPGLPGYQHATAAAYQTQQQIARQQEQMKQYNPPAAPIVFTLPETVTHNIPEETAERFLRDAQGQLLWFTVPPLDNTTARAPTGGVGHSVQYLAKRKELEARREARARAREEHMEETKRKWVEIREEEKREAKRVLVKALGLMNGSQV
ncbi:hypothetical protein K440DRAFT_175835 [Wilcoxina mikolae CBS 423.85]|nr:hypothetical protein K440DRAFT_175835 [Wilcoxina mikolae CBS 423.85]